MMFWLMFGVFSIWIILIVMMWFVLGANRNRDR